MYLQDTSLFMEDSSVGNRQMSGKTNYQLLLIASLNKEIELACKLDPEKLATEIQKIGFSCQHCGKCCRRAFGDNSVVLIPSEIERIRKYTGLSKLEVAGPFVPDVTIPNEPGENEENNHDDSFRVPEKNDEPVSSEFLKLLQEDIDCEGNIHAFGWLLRRKRNGDCIFLEKDTNKCRVYPVRPMICSTYPFYIEELRLQICECEGLGYPISAEDNKKLAENLICRYISELEDRLNMYGKFVNFRRGEKGPELAKKSLENGTCTYIVHDSTGSTKVID